MRASKRELEQLYFVEGLSTSAIAPRFGIGRTTVKRWFKHYDIKTFPNGYWQRRQANYNGVFRRIDTAEKAYWLGFIAGDGCIYESVDPNGNNAYTLTINLSSVDCKHLKKFACFIGANEKSVRSYTSPPRKNGRKSRMVVFRSRSYHLCKDLMRHGITPRKTHTITGAVIPEHYQLPFILGLFDADGTLVLHRKPQMTWDAHWSITGNRPLMEAVRSKLGLNTDVITPRGRKSSQVYAGGRFCVAEVMGGLHASCPVRLERKYKQYKALNEYNKQNKRFRTDDAIYSRIEKLRESYHSINQIAEILNVAGLKTVKGNKWTRSAVWRILKVRMPQDKFEQIRSNRNWNEKTEKHIVLRIVKMRSEGMTYRAIAGTLNAEGITTYFGNLWRASTVHQIVKRCGSFEPAETIPN